MPHNRQVSLLLANCHVQMGDYKKAVELLDPWERETPDDLTLNYLLGTALIRDNQTARGSQVIDRILRNGDSAEARLLLGPTKLNAKDFAGARGSEKGHQIESRAAGCSVLSRTGGQGHDGYGRSEAAFRTELERNPTNYIATLQLGVVARQDRRYDEARSLFERCLNMRPRDAAIRYQLATVELGGGKSSFYGAKMPVLSRACNSGGRVRRSAGNCARSRNTIG